MDKEQFLGASLRTGLKFDIKSDLYPYPTLIGIRKDYLEFNYHGVYLSFQKDFVGVPIARPLSDLNKPITHNGETFVPIIKLLEMEQSLGLTYATLNMKVTEVSCNKSDKFSTHNVEYTEPYTNMDDGIITFSYSEQFRRFGKVMSHPYRQPLGVGYQIDLFLKLIEWHFNLMDKSETFIPVTDEFNPYK